MRKSLKNQKEYYLSQLKSQRSLLKSKMNQRPVILNSKIFQKRFFQILLIIGIVILILKLVWIIKQESEKQKTTKRILLQAVLKKLIQSLFNMAQGMLQKLVEKYYENK